MSIHNDPELYPAPGDFRPERFCEQTFNPFEFLPFGGGNRRCIGAGFSEYEMRMALSEIISSIRVEPTNNEVDIRHDIAMGPKTGVLLRILERKRR